jgi:glycosyltransferase involved in cell wall biosynthesis
MKFLHLSAADHGGAGIAAWRMHDGLRALGHASRMFVLDRRSSDTDVLVLGKDASSFRLSRILQKFWLKLSSRPDFYFQNQLFSARLDADEFHRLAGLKPDVIVVHFISHFLGPGDVRALQQITDAPVLWHLLDMGHLTGGCHYAWRCEGYLSSCGSCPALRWSGISDSSNRIWRTKYSEMGGTRGWVIAGSSLLARQAAVSSLFHMRHIETLLLGISQKKFAPGDVPVLRKELGIEKAEKVIFFGAQKFNQRRKGMHLLFEGLSRLADDWPLDSPLPALLAAGIAMDFSPLRKKGFNLIDLGFVDANTLAKTYAAADLFACPSIEDSGPMMINESMMSGTPVVAFRMGVAEDLIEDGVTGAIAELGNVVEFAEGMRRILLWDAGRYAAARQRCRSLALEKCSTEHHLERFVEVAEALVRANDVGALC